MSVTFRAAPTSDDRTARRARYDAVLASRCPSCGGAHSFVAEGPRADLSCDVCLGYGADPAAERAMERAEAAEDGPSLNVANMNAVALLRVLGLMEVEIEGLAGSMDAATLLMRLAIAEAVPTEIAREARAPERHVAVVLTADGVDEVVRGWDPGLSADRIAEYAQERGVEVIWD